MDDERRDISNPANTSKNKINSNKHCSVNDTAIIPRSANQFSVEYRRNNNLKKEEQDKIITSVKKGGVAYGTNTYIKKESLPTLLDTDKKGAAIVLNNANKDDIKEIDGTTLLSTPAAIKEVTKKLEQPRSALQQEKLRQSQYNIEDFSNNPELRYERVIAYDRIQIERKKIGKQTLKKRKSKTSELSGKPLIQAEVHHKDRVADYPEKVNDPDNLVVLEREEHMSFHKSDYLPTSEGFEQYQNDFKLNTQLKK